MRCSYLIAEKRVERFSLESFCSNMYILIRSEAALVIDPHVDPEAEALLKEHHVKECTIFLTHEHFDHISGVQWLREHFQTQVHASEGCAENIQSERKNMSMLADVLIMLSRYADKTPSVVPFSCYADHIVEDNSGLMWNGLEVKCRYTPGHSKGSICIELDDDCLFTGDSLLPIPAVLRLPGGSKLAYEEITLPYLRQFDRKTMVFPGHEAPGCLEEMAMD